MSRTAQMEEQIADERKISAVLARISAADQRLVRKHFANLGKLLLRLS